MKNIYCKLQVAKILTRIQFLATLLKELGQRNYPGEILTLARFAFFANLGVKNLTIIIVIKLMKMS